MSSIANGLQLSCAVALCREASSQLDLSAELRDPNRTRRKLVGVMAADKNRLQKVLEDANIKLTSVVSKVDGVSSMNLIQALMTKDELTREEIKALVHGKLRSKIDQLVEALNGKLTDHHRFLLKMHLENIAFMAEQIQELDVEIAKRMIPFQKGIQSDSDNSWSQHYNSFGDHR